MRHIAALVIMICLTSCSDKAETLAQNQTGQNNATTRNTTHNISASSATARPNTYLIGPHSFEITFKEFLSHFSHDSTAEEGGWLRVRKNGATLFGLSDKNDLQDRKVRMIELYSSDIRTENGIHVGMSIKELQ